VIQELVRVAGLESGDDADRGSAKLAALAGRSGVEPSRAVPLLTALLSIPPTAAYPAPDMTPQQQKTATLMLLADLLAGLARSGPVLMVVEDLHWVDPTTRELLDLVVGRIETLPVLLMVTFRPELGGPLGGSS
jgi:predicted ATPase